VVCNYYGGKSRWLRRKSHEEILQRLRAGETLIFGIDYYALTPISRPFVPNEIFRKAYPVISRGGVFIYAMKGE